MSRNILATEFASDIAILTSYCRAEEEKSFLEMEPNKGHIFITILRLQAALYGEVEISKEIAKALYSSGETVYGHQYGFEGWDEIGIDCEEGEEPDWAYDEYQYRG